MSKWATLKKKLPHNYAVIVSERLTDKGFEVSPSYVSDVRRERIRNVEIQEKVWTEINILAKENQSKKAVVKSLKAI